MKILVAGDYCPQHRVADLIDSGNVGFVLGDIQTVTEHADYSIVNLECPVIRGGEVPIDKQGPSLCCNSNGITALK